MWENWRELTCIGSVEFTVVVFADPAFCGALDMALPVSRYRRERAV